MTAEELLNATSTEEVVEACIIDAETRTIYVPECYATLGVESDEKTKRVKFVCPAVVEDDVNLLDYSLRIVYQSADKKLHPPYLITDAVQNGDNIEFSWLVSRAATAYKGVVSFIFCAVKTESDGTVTNEWNTTLATSKVLDGLEEGNVYDSEEEKVDVVEQMLSVVRGEIVQADMAVNDPTSAAYVKNRTHWTEEETVYILPETMLTKGDDGEYEPIPLSQSIIVGQTYNIFWDGIEYICVAKSAESVQAGVIYIGDGTIFGLESEDVPFLIAIQNSEVYCYPIDEFVEVIISISHKTATVHTLDPKYIKDMYYTEAGGLVEILPETTVTSDEDWAAIPAIPAITLVEGETYTVTWNGVEYNTVCQCINMDGSDIYVLGDVYTYSEGNVGTEATGEPFVIIALTSEDAALIGVNVMVAFVTGGGSVTFSIKGPGGETVHPLRGKYLPEGVPWIEKFDDVILPETTLASNSNSYADVGPLQAGRTYNVYLNGVLYQCEAETLNDDYTTVGIGNCKGYGGTETNHLFTIVNFADTIAALAGYTGAVVIGGLSSDGNVTISVIGSAIYHKTEEKLLPESLVNETRANEMIALGTCDKMICKDIKLPNKAWNTICYGDEMFVAAGATTVDNVAYSRDGVHWTQINPPNEEHFYVSCYGDKFVIIGESTAIYSSDGQTWIETSLPISSDRWSSACYGNGKYVVVCYADSEKEPTDILLYSEDGITWNQATLPETAKLNSVCYGRNYFVAVGDEGAVFYSEDGLTWVKATISVSNDLHSICYGNGKFVAVGESDLVGFTSGIIYSQDGIEWTATDFRGLRASCVYYGDGKFVISTGESDHGCGYSEDGITWNYYGYPNAGFMPNRVSQGVTPCYGRNCFVLLDHNGSISCSRHGLLWSTSYFLTNDEDITLKLIAFIDAWRN